MNRYGNETDGFRAAAREDSPDRHGNAHDMAFGQQEAARTPQELYEALQKIMAQPGDAYAVITGSREFPDINGRIDFYPLWGGSIAAVAVDGLPVPEKSSCMAAFHGFHIHQGSSCAPGQDGRENSQMPFPFAGLHYNPGNCQHPQHVGDLPPLMANNGFALSIFFTDRFTPQEAAGHTVIIHQSPDDFTTQPSGNSGTMIACGEIRES